MGRHCEQDSGLSKGRDLAACPRGGWGLPLSGRQEEALQLGETVPESGNARDGSRKMHFPRRLPVIWTKRVLADLGLCSGTAAAGLV